MTEVIQPLKIQIPVHDEDGWTFRSPGGTSGVKERLTRSASRSPEEAKKTELHEARRRERAAQIHAIHLESISNRAKRELQRVADNNARRLRLEAAAHDRVQTRLEKDEVKMKNLREKAVKRREEEMARRSAREDAAREARIAILLQRDARIHEKLTAVNNANRRHAQAMHALRDKGACAVKHALTVAASTREAYRVQIDAEQEVINKRASAVSERKELAELKIKERAHRLGMLRVRATLSRRQMCNVEREIRIHELRARETRSQATREASALAISSKLAEAEAKRAQVFLNANQSAETTAKDSRHALVVRLQKAEVSRELNIRNLVMSARLQPRRKSQTPSASSQTGKEETEDKESTPPSTPPSFHTHSPSPSASPPASPVEKQIKVPTSTYIFIPAHAVGRGVGRDAPLPALPTAADEPASIPASASLLKRLLHKPTTLLSSSLSRHQSAAARRATQLAWTKAKAKHQSTTLVAQAAWRREVRSGQRASVFFARTAAAAARAGEAVRSTVARANVASRRVLRASLVRTKASLALLDTELLREAQQQRVAEKRREVISFRLQKQCAWNNVLARAAAERRAANAARLQALAVKFEVRCGLADVRREAHLSARVSRALLAQLPRVAEVKIQCDPENGRVSVLVSGASPPRRAASMDARGKEEEGAEAEERAKLAKEAAGVKKSVTLCDPREPKKGAAREMAPILLSAVCAPPAPASKLASTSSLSEEEAEGWLVLKSGGCK